MDVFKVIQTEKVIIYHIYYKCYGKIDTQIAYIRTHFNSIEKVKSEICSIQQYFY